MADSFLLSWDVTAGSSRALGNCAKVQCYVTERMVQDRARVDFRLDDDMRVIFFGRKKKKSLLRKEKKKYRKNIRLGRSN